MRPAIHWTLQLCAGLALLGAVLGAVLYFIFFRGPVDAARQGTDLAGEVAARLAGVLQLQPEVRIGGTVIIQGGREVAALVILENTFRVRHGVEHKWLHSTKRFEVEALARVYFGYDLRQPVGLEIDPIRRKLAVGLPPPEVLGIELSDFQVLRDEDGLWNKLTSTDREEALNNLRATAEESLDLPDLSGRAAAAIEARIEEAIAPLELTVRFNGRPAKP